MSTDKCPKCKAKWDGCYCDHCFHRLTPAGQIAELRRQLAAMTAEWDKAIRDLARSRLKECRDVTLADGRVFRFCTPETVAELESLQSERNAALADAKAQRERGRRLSTLLEMWIRSEPCRCHMSSGGKCLTCQAQEALALQPKESDA